MKRFLSGRLIAVAGLTIMIWVLFSLKPELALKGYTNGVFVLLRRLFNSLNLFSVLAGWILILFVLFRRVSHRRPAGGLGTYFMRLISPILWLVVAFYWLWGFNYLSMSPTARMTETAHELSTDQMLQALQMQTMTINTLRSGLDVNELGKTAAELIHTRQQLWQDAVTGTVLPMGYKVQGKALLVLAKPEGLLLRWGTAGVYNFLIGRPTIDPGLHPLQVPFTAMHELAHAYGIAGEADANYISYIAGIGARDHLSNYAAELSFWRSLSRACFTLDSTQTRTIISLADPDIQTDITAIREKMKMYPDYAPKLRDAFYDTFLKSQGVKDGLNSYEQYVDLVLKWRMAQDSIE